MDGCRVIRVESFFCDKDRFPESRQFDRRVFLTRSATLSYLSHSTVPTTYVVVPISSISQEESEKKVFFLKEQLQGREVEKGEVGISVEKRTKHI